jgi:hypothetical protein
MKKIELENGEKSSSTSSFVICPCYEKSNFDGEVGNWEALGLNNMP